MSALRERLGLPQVGTAWPFALAMAVDALGSGLFLPFSLLYFHFAAGLSLTQAGLGLTVAMLVAVPAPLLGGVLVDRTSPKAVTVAANAARLAGFLGYLFVHDLAGLIPAAVVVAVGDRLFWVAQPALVGELVGSGGRDRWFGLTVALRSAGLGIGSLLAGAAVSGLGVVGYRTLAVANACSFGLAAVSIASLRSRGPAARPLLPDAARPAGFTAVLADRPFCGVVASNLAFGIARTMIQVGIPLYAVQVLAAPAWLAGALYAVYTAILAVGQTSLVRRLERHRRTRALILAALLWATAFVLLAGAPLLPSRAMVAFLVGITVAYTVAVMLHAGAIDALVVEAAPDALVGRYVATFHLSWALANALAPALFTTLLAWQPRLPWLAQAALLLVALAGVRRVEPRLAAAAVRTQPARSSEPLARRLPQGEQPVAIDAEAARTDGVPADQQPAR